LGRGWLLSKSQILLGQLSAVARRFPARILPSVGTRALIAVNDPIPPGVLMIDPKPVLLLLTALALGGCDLTSKAASEGASASAFSGGSGSAAAGDRATATAALTNVELGRLIGAKLGAALNDDDRKLAYEAQIKALESGPPGAPMPWKNPASGRYGNIVPGPAYDRKGAQCRGYSHSVTINGQLEIARGTACRSTDGVWTAVG
jgi:surface antigen